MQMIVTIAGNSLVVMYMSNFNCKVGTGSNAVIMLMPVVKGYIAYKFMSVVFKIVFFTGYA
jgi:hypothetical protein